MKSIALLCFMLCVSLLLYAEYVPQSLIFSSIDEIEIITSYSDSLYTDCAWFNTLSGNHWIYYLELLYDFKDNGVDIFCYYIKYKDETSVEDMMALLESENKVTVAEPNYLFELHNDPLLNDQWALPLISMDQVWSQYSYYGDDILVGVVDSGVDLGLNDPQELFYGQIHPDLEDNLYTDGNGHHGFNAYAFEHPDPDSSEVYNVQDQLGHGTHVAGIIAGRKNNAYGISGIAGGNAITSANGCQVYSVRVGGTFNNKGLSLSAIYRGIVRAHRFGVRIFNCSFGFRSSSQGAEITQFVNLINNLSNPQLNDPALFICSAGNDWAEVSNYPAALPYTLSVAATTINDTKAGYSTYHQSVDIGAPGGSGGGANLSSGILSTTPRDELFYMHVYDGYNKEFAYMSGTSMAAPMVTAAVVLTKQAHPTLNLHQIRQRLQGTADDISQANPEIKYIGKLGSGRLNVLKAIETDNPYPTLRLHTVNVDNDTYIPCGAQSLNMNITMRNWWAPTQGSVTGTLFTSDPDIYITNSTLNFTHLGQNEYDLFSTSVVISDNSALPGTADFSIQISYDGITETLYFSIPQRVNISNSKISVPNRTAISEMTIDDMNMDGKEEIAFITEDSQNANLVYLCLIKSGITNEAFIDGSSNCKPAFADMNHDGTKELVLFDGAGRLLLYDYSLNLVYASNPLITAGEISSFVVEDINSDGRLDVVFAHTNGGNSFIDMLVFVNEDGYNFIPSSYLVDNGYRIISPLAVGIVDDSVNNDIIWIESNYNPQNAQDITTNLCKLTYFDGRGENYRVYKGTIDEVVVGNDIINDYGCTDIILSRPHPSDSNFPWAYIYVGIGYTRVAGVPPLNIQTAKYKLLCFDFSGETHSEVWSHQLSDNPLNQINSAQKAYNIIAGDFLDQNPGNEILVGATEEVIDSETGEFIQFLTKNIQGFPPNNLTYVNHHYQPAVIVDYNNNDIQDVFVYNGTILRSYDANKNLSETHNYVLPQNNEVYSIVAGKNRDSSIHDVYALSSSSGNTYLFYIPISSNHELFYYEWRQFNNNARKTCELLQGLPAFIASPKTLWNHCEFDKDVTVDSYLTIVSATRVKFQSETGLVNYGIIEVQGNEDYPVTFSGVCPYDLLSYWDGISLHSNSLINIGYAKLSNAFAALDIYNTGDNLISDCKFTYNKYSLKVYQALLDLESSIIENSVYGVTAFNNSEINLGYATGSNRITHNEIGVYSHTSSPYLDEGNNDINNPDDGAFNIYSVNTPNGIKAQYNWWGNNGYDPTYVASKLNNPSEVVFEPFSEVSYFGRAFENRASTDFIMAEMLRCNGSWAQAAPFYYSVIQDSLSSSEKYLSINGLFNCFQNLNNLGTHKSWLEAEINTTNDLIYGKFLRNNLAMTNRILGNYQDALDYYESILDNNPSYADSCYAVIDIGFTWLESESLMRGKYPLLCPRTINDHIVTTNKLLTSILLDTPIHGNNITPLLPKISNNYPNPFNPSTTIEFSIPQTGRVKLSIYNIRGQKVKTLINGDIERGKHRVVWDGRDDGNRSVASGVYFIRLEAEGKSTVRKAMLLK